VESGPVSCHTAHEGFFRISAWPRSDFAVRASNVPCDSTRVGCGERSIIGGKLRASFGGPSRGPGSTEIRRVGSRNDRAAGETAASRGPCGAFLRLGKSPSPGTTCGRECLQAAAAFDPFQGASVCGWRFCRQQSAGDRRGSRKISNRNERAAAGFGEAPGGFASARNSRSGFAADGALSDARHSAIEITANSHGIEGVEHVRYRF
jgi:hypothetical protein